MPEESCPNCQRMTKELRTTGIFVGMFKKLAIETIRRNSQKIMLCSLANKRYSEKLPSSLRNLFIEIRPIGIPNTVRFKMLKI